jgi:hypothetical protein
LLGFLAVPLRKDDAKRLIRQLMQAGKFYLTPHARTERDKDKLGDVDIVDVLRAGMVSEAEHENGEWRHQVRTQRITVVVAFEPAPDEAEDENDVELVVVTVWRSQP